VIGKLRELGLENPVENGLYVPQTMQDTDDFNPVLTYAVENQVVAHRKFV
jgi:hypothetical protein